MNIWKDFLYVGLGGFLGAVMRYSICFFFTTCTANKFPFATLVVNITGSFFMGVLSIFLQDFNQYWRLFFIIGIVGGFTTFSSFSYETLVFLNNKQFLEAFFNIIFNLILCLLSIYIGFQIGKYLFDWTSISQSNVKIRICFRLLSQLITKRSKLLHPKQQISIKSMLLIIAIISFLANCSKKLKYYWSKTTK